MSRHRHRHHDYQPRTFAFADNNPTPEIEPSDEDDDVYGINTKDTMHIEDCQISEDSPILAAIQRQLKEELPASTPSPQVDEKTGKEKISKTSTTTITRKTA